MTRGKCIASETLRETAGFKVAWELCDRIGPYHHPIDETFDRVLDALFDRLQLALKP